MDRIISRQRIALSWACARYCWHPLFRLGATLGAKKLRLLDRWLIKAFGGLYKIFKSHLLFDRLRRVLLAFYCRGVSLSWHLWLHCSRGALVVVIERFSRFSIAHCRGKSDCSCWCWRALIISSATALFGFNESKIGRLQVRRNTFFYIRDGVKRRLRIDDVSVVTVSALLMRLGQRRWSLTRIYEFDIFFLITPILNRALRLLSNWLMSLSWKSLVLDIGGLGVMLASNIMSYSRRKQVLWRLRNYHTIALSLLVYRGRCVQMWRLLSLSRHKNTVSAKTSRSTWLLAIVNLAYGFILSSLW